MAFEGSRTITFKAGGDFLVFHLWSDMQGEKSHDVSDTPNNTGIATQQVNKASPSVARGSIKISSGVFIPATLNDPRGVSQADTTMTAQRDALYALEGQTVTAYARSLPNGFMSGILRMVRVADDGRYDNTQTVSFELKEDLGAGSGFNALSLIEADSITVPRPEAAPIDSPTAPPPPPATGKKRCVRTNNLGVRARRAIGDVWKDISNSVTQGWKATTNWFKKNVVNPVVDFGKWTGQKIRDGASVVNDRVIVPIVDAYDAVAANVKGFLFGQCSG